MMNRRVYVPPDPLGATKGQADFRTVESGNLRISYTSSPNADFEPPLPASQFTDVGCYYRCMGMISANDTLYSTQLDAACSSVIATDDQAAVAEPAV